MNTVTIPQKRQNKGKTNSHQDGDTAAPAASIQFSLRSPWRGAASASPTILRYSASTSRGGDSDW